MDVNARRRRILRIGGGLITGTADPAWAADLVATPAQVRGPFYPLMFALDQHNDLVSLGSRPRTAYGMTTDVAGQVLDDKGHPHSGGRVQSWQVKRYGRDHRARDDSDKPIAPNFQGYGRKSTGADSAIHLRCAGALIGRQTGRRIQYRAGGWWPASAWRPAGGLPAGPSWPIVET
jgi:protocatechuate 3,4-dioxygenase beta subunit